MNPYLAPVPLEKVTRLINHGPTVLVSARHAGVSNVMTAAWCCALDFTPPKLTVVLDKATHTRALVEQSGRLVIQIPTAGQLKMTHTLGNVSMNHDPEKLTHCDVELFELGGQDLPFVEGCAAWLVCKTIPETHNQQQYDLFIAEIIAAWADNRVFHDGHWLFEEADPAMRSLHHVAGGHFYAIGDALKVRGVMTD